MGETSNELEQLEKDYQDAKNNKEYILGTKILKDILTYLRNNNHNGTYKNKISFYKKELKENNKKSMSSFVHHTIKTEITNEEMDNFLNDFLEEEKIEVLMKKIGSQIFIDNNDILEMQNEGGFDMLSICNINIYDDDGNIIKGGDNYELHTYHSNYNLHLSVRELYISIILEKLFREKKITIPKILKYFQDNIYIFPTYKTYYKFHKAIERFGEQDYVSSMHILIPTLEEVILYISGKLGLDVISLDREQKGVYTGGKTLGSNFILSEEFQNKWTKNFSILIDNIFFSPMGYKLRHKIAHGTIDYFECNFRTNSLVLIIFIYITLLVHLEED